MDPIAPRLSKLRLNLSLSVARLYNSGVRGLQQSLDATLENLKRLVVLQLILEACCKLTGALESMSSSRFLPTCVDNLARSRA